MKFASSEQLLILSVILAAIPLMVVTATCYLKCSVVLSLLRGGFGTQQAPSNAMVMALSLVISLAVMEPVGQEVYAQFTHLKTSDLTRLPVPRLIERVGETLAPWQRFLRKHCGERELEVFSGQVDGVVVSGATASNDPQPEVRPIQLLAAFVLSEIRRGFVAAFVLLIPFFVVDVVVANVLVGLGLTMMSPVVVSLPIKLLLFITCDGWLLLASGMLQSYN
jgi:type III secretory pathway component EscR